jgi:hypothetical protein
LLTQQRLKELLSYDPLTGEFRWLVNRRRGAKAGDIAGTIYKNGYRRIGIDGRYYYASRLAVFYMTGSWPKHEVDHRDTDRANDRWTNLREATRSQNIANQRPRNKLGIKGVRQTRAGTYHVQIQVAGRHIHLGTYNVLTLASDIYRINAAYHHREFARAA